MPNGDRALKHEWAFIDDLDAQDHTKKAMRAYIQSRVKNAATVEVAAKAAGVTVGTIQGWRNRYPEFREMADVLTAGRENAQAEIRKHMKLARLGNQGLVLPRTPTFPEEKPNLVDFTRIYFGRPSLPHHEAMSRAWEDQTNTKIMVLLPTGGGKDTKANDFIIHSLCDDRGLLRTAFILENEDFAKRRLARVVRYLTEPALYGVAPALTPGGTVPERNLIDDYGPFRWEKGMVYPDGEEVPRPKWNAFQLDFVGSQINEADPQLWATGLSGDLYGSRLMQVVLSDIFTQKNQANPTIRAGQLDWIDSTFESRLDGVGRVLMIGTMLFEENNYEVLATDWSEGAGIIESDEYYTKYRNGFAIVRWPAILAEGTDRERSFWEDKFPYRSQLVLYDQSKAVVDRVESHTLTNEEFLEKRDLGYTPIKGQLEMRGTPGTRQWKHYQATHQQHREQDGQQIDFTDDILDMADDFDRSWGMVYDHEICVQGVDPAKVYGAAVSVVAVNRRENTITPVYDFFDSDLGIEGIKRKLILGPAITWMPLWLVYEINKHEGVLEDSEVRKELKNLGVNVHPHKTTPHNRNSLDDGPAGLVSLMRARIWRWPMRTEADRQKTRQVKEHFKAWDRHQGETQRKSRPGQAGHKPDDRCMANWMCAIKAVPLLEAGQRRGPKPRNMVPPSVLRRWEAYHQGRNEREGIRAADATWHEGQDLERLLGIVAGQEGG